MLVMSIDWNDARADGMPTVEGDYLVHWAGPDGTTSIARGDWWGSESALWFVDPAIVGCDSVLHWAEIPRLPGPS